MKTKTISLSDLLETFKTICARGARPITLHLDCEARVSARCPFNGVRKNSLVNGFLNFNYQRSVNRQREREEKPTNFQSETNWFVHWQSDPWPIVRHREDFSALYLQVKTERPISTVFYDNTGTTIPREDLAEYLPAPSRNPKQNLERPVLTMTPSFDSIMSFNCDGTFYKVVRD